MIRIALLLFAVSLGFGQTCTSPCVAQSAKGASSGSIVTSPSVNSSTATLLVVATSQYTVNTNTACTVSDTVGGTVGANSWSVVVFQNGASTHTIALWYAWKASGGGALVTGASHTATTTCTGFGNSIAFAAFSGTLTGSDPYDGHSNSAVATAPGSITPGEINALVISAAACQGTSPGCTAGYGSLAVSGGFTYTTMDGGTATIEAAIAFLRQTSAVAANPTWTMGGNESTVIAAFKPGVSTGAPLLPLTGVGER